MCVLTYSLSSFVAQAWPSFCPFWMPFLQSNSIAHLIKFEARLTLEQPQNIQGIIYNKPHTLLTNVSHQQNGDGAYAFTFRHSLIWNDSKMVVETAPDRHWSPANPSKHALNSWNIPSIIWVRDLVTTLKSTVYFRGPKMAKLLEKTEMNQL